MSDLDTQWVTVFGYQRAQQCKAKSKRSGGRCRRPACIGKAVCHIHGGRSTGPKTAEGRSAIAAANTVHGRETRPKRTIRAQKLHQLQELEEHLRQQGMITGKRISGRRSKRN